MPNDKDLLNQLGELSGHRVWQIVGGKSQDAEIKCFDDHSAKLARMSINIIILYFNLFLLYIFEVSKNVLDIRTANQPINTR
jgi:hypothetical protein